MKWGFLKALGKLGGSISPVMAAVMGAVNVIEAVRSDIKGKSKEDAAMALLPSMVLGLDMAGVDMNMPLLQEATRKVMATYVAAENAKAAFEEAKDALEALVADTKARNQKKP